ncbi:neutral zinc metallopeptidase [Actinoplanes bogorensis]|uniref:Neutral zinc metallopeptidase n=1 Tax=Paractinoplanes bogorensis TaxID=1610840 RepID=A0ABS5YRX4_9ACTN|nr:neutral zinc metallopeptidase [Actinoplanes bogorensis]MBU2665841.1 neutral zinc metallopeptidase [Actinoplanes bogorensis]
MELNENADIDTSQVEDRRGSGGGGGGGLGGLPIGGGGLVGIIITIVVALVGGYFGINSMGGGSGASTGDNTNIDQKCDAADALDQLDCRNTLYVNSIQNYWKSAAPENFNVDYQPAKTVIFEQRVSTACGAADSGVGPFYCPGDNNVYIDLSFYQVLAKQLGASGEFAQPYVLAHEYGHHIQDITGTEAKMRQAQSGASNAEKNALSVKLELQADCYAGAWAKSASTTTDKDGVQIFKSLTVQDIQEGIQAAGQIGDDTLQKRSGNPVNPEEFTHGTSAQRQEWFSKGYNGSPKSCAQTF